MSGAVPLAKLFDQDFTDLASALGAARNSASVSVGFFEQKTPLDNVPYSFLRGSQQRHATDALMRHQSTDIQVDEQRAANRPLFAGSIPESCIGRGFQRLTDMIVFRWDVECAVSPSRGTRRFTRTAWCTIVECSTNDLKFPVLVVHRGL
jgi:hypothetical protein